MVYGFIGLGNMAGAILRGMAGSGNFSCDTLCGFNRSPEKTRKLAQEIGLVPCESAKEVAEKADVLVLGAKPQMLPDVLEPIKGAIHPDKLVVTIAAGKGFSFYASYFGETVPLVRVMPNIWRAGPVLGERRLPERSMHAGAGGACARDVPLGGRGL